MLRLGRFSSLIKTASSPDHFVTSEAENRAQRPALLLTRVTPYGTIRLREAALVG